MAESKVIRETWSVCPVCFKRIAARQALRDGIVYLEKSCPEHGAFSTVVWRSSDLEAWRGGWPAQTEEPKACPDNCGLCSEHLQKTCCVLIEVTNRCNLHCLHCFAEGKIPGAAPDTEGGAAPDTEGGAAPDTEGGAAPDTEGGAAPDTEGGAAPDTEGGAASAWGDPSIEEVKGWIRDIAGRGKCFLQLSGGEPTMRGDLPELIAYAKEVGCEYVQLNSNGIRLGQEPDYAAELSAAGLDFVFMQFDGTEDSIFERLRGRKGLLEIKKKAIERCGAVQIGVTLVPMVVPGINDKNIGELVKYGISLSPVVRGIHFQPVSYFGCYETPPADSARITLPEILEAMEEQTAGLVRQQYFAASCCDHPMCGFHGDFIALPEGLQPLTRRKDCCTPATAEQNRNFIGRRWKREKDEAAEGGCGGEAAQEEECGCGGEVAAEECCCGPAQEKESCCCDGGPAQEEECCCCGTPEAENCCCDGQTAEECCCGPAQEKESCCCDEPVTEECCCCGTPEATAAAVYEAQKEAGCCETDGFDTFLRNIKTYGFTITSMAFQDAYTLDLERLRNCSLHVYQEGRMVPFCSRYLPR